MDGRDGKTFTDVYKRQLSGNATEMIRFVDEKVALDYDNFVKIIGNYDADSDHHSLPLHPSQSPWHVR